MSNTQNLRFQISLKTIFWLMVVVAAFFAGWGVAERRAQRAVQRAREEFEAATRVSEESALLAATLARREAEATAAYARAVAESYRKAQEGAYRTENGSASDEPKDNGRAPEKHPRPE
jgi:hypothetical protein